MWGCLADEHIATVVVQVLRQAGVDLVTVRDLGLKGADDSIVAQRAFAEQRIVLTRDADFMRLAAEVWQLGHGFPPVIYWPQGTSRSLSHLLTEIVQITNEPNYTAICRRVFWI